MLAFGSNREGIYKEGRARPDWAYEFPGRTGPESKFAGLVLPDRTESGLIFLNILYTKYGLSILLKIRSLDTNLVSTALLDQINKKKLKKKF